MTQLRQRVERLENAETTSLHFGASANAISSFPGMVNLVAGSGVSFTPGTGTLTITATGGGGTVTSVGMSVPSFLSVSGSPVTTSGTLAVTYSGTALPIANGGSGQTTANAALNAFLPAQATHSGKVLQTDGTNTSWQTNGSGTVTSVAVSVNNGISVSGSPITTSGTFTLGLGAITPTSVSTSNLTVSSTVSVPAQSIALASIPNSAGLSVLGRSAASSGVRSDITSTGARTFLASSSANTAVAFRAMEAADLPNGNWIGATNGTTVCTTTTLTSNSNAWEAVTGTISLPAAGTYLVSAYISGNCATSSLSGVGNITARLFNVTDGTEISNTEVYVCGAQASGVYAVGSTQTGAVITVAGAKTIRIEAQRNTATGTVYLDATINSATGGRTRITYIRLY